MRVKIAVLRQKKIKKDIEKIINFCYYINIYEYNFQFHFQGGAKMDLFLDNEFDKKARILVAGVGGGGGNAVSRMIESGMSSVEFLMINTDQQALFRASDNIATKISIGDKLTHGRGAGGVPEKGQRAAEESRDEIAAAIEGAQMLFITAGMGGGTGTGAAPVIAGIAKEMGILTIGVVTKPFDFEGKVRKDQAELGITALREQVDSLLIIPNERLKLVAEENITFLNAFILADDVLRQAVKSISDLINGPGVINLDFADVVSIMKGAGTSHMGLASASGENKAEEAANKAVSSPLLETSINGARGIIFNITASPDISLNDVDTVSSIIKQNAHPEANIIFGFAYDDNMHDELSISIVATDFVDDVHSASGFVNPFDSMSKEDGFGFDDIDQFFKNN